MYKDIGNMTKEQQIKNAGIYLTPAIISNILPIISLPIILKYLSPAEYGSYALSLAFAAVVVGFCQFSLLGVYERNFFVYKDEKKRSQLLYTIAIFVFGISFLVGVLIFINKDILSRWITQNREYGVLLFFTFCAWAMFQFNNYFLTYLKNIGNAKVDVMFTVSGSILAVLLNIYFVSIMKIGPLGLALGLLISNSLIFISINIYFLKRMAFSLNHSLLFNSLKLSLPLVPIGIFQVAARQFDKYIIGVLASIDGIGIYSIGQRISNLAFLFMTAIQKVYGPIVYHKMFSIGAKGGKEIGKYLTPFAYFSVAAALFLSLLSEEALIILAPPEYLKGIGVINLLCIFYAITFFAKQPQIMYAGKTTVLSMLSLINVVCTVVVLYVFVNYYGVLGAAAGIVIVGFIYVALLIWKGQQYYRIHYEVRKLISIYGLLIFMSISTLLFREIGMVYPIRLLIKVLYGTMFVGLGVYLKVLTRENLLMVLKRKSK